MVITYCKNCVFGQKWHKTPLNTIEGECWFDPPKIHPLVGVQQNPLNPGNPGVTMQPITVPTVIQETRFCHNGVPKVLSELTK